MHKKILFILVNYILVGAIDAAEEKKKIQYIVRTDFSRLSEERYNKARQNIEDKLKDKSLSPQQQRELLLRLSVMSHISDEIRECFAQKLVQEAGNNNTETILNALIKAEDEGMITPTYIQNTYERNIMTPDSDYPRFKKSGLEETQIAALIKKMIDCSLINPVLIARKLSLGKIIGPKYYIDPVLMHELNSFLQLVEAITIELFSDHSYEEKESNLKKLAVEGNISLETVKAVSGKGFVQKIPETKVMLRSKMLGLIQKYANEELKRQAQFAKTLVLPSATQPSGAAVASEASATPQDVISLSIALRSVAA